MDLRAELQIAVMIRAMDRVVLPAVDSANRPAQEQGHLVLAMLRLLEKRLHLTYRYERDELQRYAGLAEALAAALAGTDRFLPALTDAARQAEALLRRPGAAQADLVEKTAALRRVIGDIAGALSRMDTNAARVKQLIFAAAKVQIERERGWLLPTGFETVPDGITPIEEQLQSASANAASAGS